MNRPTLPATPSLPHPPRPGPRRASAVAALLCLALPATVPAADGAAPAASAAAAKPALTVTVAQPERQLLPLLAQANGSIAAWQEASIGTESNGWRLAEVKVNVGDVVRRGQPLARFDTTLAQADLAQLRATVAEAEASLAEAAANAQRARDLQTTGALSAQQINQYLTAERTAQARLDAQRATAQAQQLRIQQAQVLAPDDGVVSARSATVGAVLPAGQELFRLIRQGRLEWRAEVPAAELAAIRPGTAVRLTPAGGQALDATVRMVGPTVDPATRNGLVYVDLPRAAAAQGGAKAGMFARGEFRLGQTSALTLPQAAVQLREGFSQVLAVGPDSKLRALKVATGRRVGDRVEITSALPADVRVVASGAGFLADGDLVRVVAGMPAAAAASTPATPATPAATTKR